MPISTQPSLPNASFAPVSEPFCRLLRVGPFTRALLLTAILCSPTFAASPWERAVDVLATAFTGPIAKGLSLVAVVVGGVTFAFGEGDSKRLLAGIIFGVGMAIGAANFLTWLFF